MGIFGFGKKKAENEKPVCACRCGESSGEEKFSDAANCCCESGDEGCNIKVLGAGCKACHEQYENVKAAVSEMNLEAGVEYITDMEKVMTYGVMSMPAIVVNEKVVSMGKVLKKGQVVDLLKKMGC